MPLSSIEAAGHVHVCEGWKPPETTVLYSDSTQIQAKTIQALYSDSKQQRAVCCIGREPGIGAGSFAWQATIQLLIH